MTVARLPVARSPFCYPGHFGARQDQALKQGNNGKQGVPGNWEHWNTPWAGLKLQPRVWTSDAICCYKCAV